MILILWFGGKSLNVYFNMKKRNLSIFLILLLSLAAILSCKRDSDYIAVKPSPFISNFDLRKLYKNAAISLGANNLNGASYLKGIVISDVNAGNMPNGLLFLQNSRITGISVDSLRGIAINLGATAAKFSIGDSLHIKIEGTILKKQNGYLQIDGVNPDEVVKIAGGKTVRVRTVSTTDLLNRPDFFESTLINLANVFAIPEPQSNETFAGDKIFNDGVNSIVLHTETNANFANQILPASGSFTGVFLPNNQPTAVPLQLLMRNFADAVPLPLIKPSGVIIAGFLPDPQGTDASATDQCEYIQLLATKDIDFAATPYALVTTNNAGSTNPFPVNGWATGALRTYKINLNQGSVKKGQFFYVGGTSKLIWGVGSSSIASANWIATVNYASNPGADFGTATTNLLANGGNFAGIAIFEGLNVDKNTTPADVICYGGANGNVYNAGPPELGYRITNTDYYVTINNQKNQVFYGSGNNTFRFGFQATQSNPTGGSFVNLGGVYDAKTGRWMSSRVLKSTTMALNATLATIEQNASITKIVN